MDNCMNDKIEYKAYHPMWSTYSNMLQRCNNPKRIDYHRYGGRGIKVCDRWLENFDDFVKDMGDKPTPKHTLDRIDGDKGYSPENCRWATYKEQQNNRCDNIRITHKGMRKTAAEWADYSGLKRSTFNQRFYTYKWSIGKCLTPLQRIR